MEDRWNQEEIIHCPWKDCKGMLLRHPYHFELKCSNCGRYWLQHITLTQAEKPARICKFVSSNDKRCK